MGQYRTYTAKVFLRLEPATRARLEERARRDGKTLSDLLRDWIAKMLAEGQDREE